MNRKEGKFDGKFADMQFIVKVFDRLKIECIRHCEWDAANELQLDIIHCKLKQTKNEGKRMTEHLLYKYADLLKRYNIKFETVELGVCYNTKRYKEVTCTK